ncbi:hypothetical protein CERZMDRAFT_100642 [Cercospora zeae-maydis SCOH1-5]|uniref:Uncharacterized protein n=1 Tax=Cercospora zeae-maydis SCOH1-5 TaxID=717836 RepID=A0A6A6F5L4_9PEZI|nr:hypothetical protein CERZMDRAFT_100642 [Cercospora zeae-maydis SCOH1-5]
MQQRPLYDCMCNSALLTFDPTSMPNLVERALSMEQRLWAVDDSKRYQACSQGLRCVVESFRRIERLTRVYVAAYTTCTARCREQDCVVFGDPDGSANSQGASDHLVYTLREPVVMGEIRLEQYECDIIGSMLARKGLLRMCSIVDMMQTEAHKVGAYQLSVSQCSQQLGDKLREVNAQAEAIRSSIWEAVMGGNGTAPAGPASS